jgi:hypothetical protein
VAAALDGLVSPDADAGEADAGAVGALVGLAAATGGEPVVDAFGPSTGVTPGDALLAA